MPLRRIQQDLSARLANRHGWVNLRTIIAVRWIGISGQTGAIIFSTLVLGYKVPLLASAATIAASVLMNMWAVQRLQRGPTINDRVAAGFLIFDTLQLAMLLYLTGGLANPFAMMLLVPLTVGAAILRRQLIIALSATMIAAASLLAFAPNDLPWGNGSLPPIFTFGVWMALVLSAIFIALYVYSIAVGAGLITTALQESRLALSRQQKLAAVGALASAAAHELGTPLSTIAVIAKELVHDLPPGSAQAEDAALLLTQVDRCRTILADLAQRPDRSGDIMKQRFNHMGLQTFLASIAEPYRKDHIELVFRNDPDNIGAEPLLRPLPELQHGLANLLQNALQFARSRVIIDMAWNTDMIRVQILDDGPGMPPALLERIGEPYISTRTDKDGHMGLGIFIAMNLLEKAGATVYYDNLSQGGTATIVTWQGSAALGIIKS